MKLQETVTAVKAEIEALEAEVVRLEQDGVKKAAGEARKIAQAIKVLMGNLRKDIQSHKAGLPTKTKK
jgi:hypothetical protein